ncbi:MAG TPA: RluA family pseudouridine synthase [Phycisphaerae bacterium]|nr:RluA family pseudouridine synthase [Phycisphaerae bacterium]
MSPAEKNSTEEPIEEQNGLQAVETPIEAEEDGLAHVRISVRHALPGRRIDKYLAARLGRTTSRTALQEYIREGSVTVNDRIVKPSYAMRTGDVIDMTLPAVRPLEIPPEPIPLDVIYEDDDLIAINKQADLIVHPARGNWTGTLVNALAYYFKTNWRDIKELPTSGEAFRPGIVHRLDRDTTGVILVAKTELALWRLGRQFELRHVQKTYIAIVHGSVELDEDVIDLPIGKHPKVREKYAVHRGTGRPYSSTTKPAVTRYKVLERMEHVGRSKASFSLVELYPKTGRTHQLRVHMSSLGHPIVGDRMYGGGPVYRSQLEGRADEAVGALITRQALHARTIVFQHPRTGKRMEISAPLPADFVEALSVLKDLARKV